MFASCFFGYLVANGRGEITIKPPHILAQNNNHLLANDLGCLGMDVIWARVHPVFKMPCNAMLLPGTFISVSIWKWSHGDFLFTELPLGLWCYFYRIVHRLFSYGQRCYHRPVNELHHSTGHTSVPRT